MLSGMPDRTPAPARQRAALINTRSQETRRALIRAALRLWGDGDFEDAYATSTGADIARAAGVSKGTFYFHFTGKEDILREMSSATVQQVIDQIEVGTRRGVPLRALSEQALAAMARRIARAPRAAALLAGTLGFTARAGEVTLTGPRLGDAFETLLRYGKERGELPPSTDIGEVAAMLTAVTMEAIIRWGAETHSTEWLRRTFRDRVGIILRGIGHTASD